MILPIVFTIAKVQVFPFFLALLDDISKYGGPEHEAVILH